MSNKHDRKDCQADQANEKDKPDNSDKSEEKPKDKWDKLESERRPAPAVRMKERPKKDKAED
jgi:hypothetical protein